MQRHFDIMFILERRTQRTQSAKLPGYHFLLHCIARSLSTLVPLHVLCTLTFTVIHYPHIHVLNTKIIEIFLPCF
jgi:hypothetical protein